jgi:hypothetical protein
MKQGIPSSSGVSSRASLAYRKQVNNLTLP